MLKSKFIIFLLILFILTPFTTAALSMPQNGNDLASMAGLNATAYLVQDTKTGEVLISKNENLKWTPASLTKLVTALVVLDQKTKLNKSVAITAQDQSLGGCSVGGACIRTKAGVKYTVDSLFHATLIMSANNAANALSRSTGLSPEAFAKKMNEKVKSLGASNSNFNEPTGMDPTNSITASDYAKIVAAAFSNKYIKDIAGLKTYYLRSSSNSKYNQTIKNTDKLLSDSEVTVLGAKTGYLNESKYNFASLVKYGGGELAVVVLGENHLYSAFSETKQLISMAEQTRQLALINFSPLVLGTSTEVTLK